jgi:hypothetical protein
MNERVATLRPCGLYLWFYVDLEQPGRYDVAVCLGWTE